jgi:Peptidase family M28
METLGWNRILEGWPWFKGAGNYSISAYSEFMPPPLLGVSPYGSADPLFFKEEDPWQWPVTEYEEGFELSPGLAMIAQSLLKKMMRLANGRPPRGIPIVDLADNPYWPEALARHVGSLNHERFVLLVSMALARTQDDKGRVRWTLFGSSEQGPERAFWSSFFTAPGRELPAEQILDFLRRLLRAAFSVAEPEVENLQALGLRVLPTKDDPQFPYWRMDPLPSAIGPLLLRSDESVGDIRFLLTFRPFADLPPAIQGAYLAGNLHLLPFPGSLIFWGMGHYRKLQQQLPLAIQIPLLHLFKRHEAPHGIRVPQSGWLYEGRLTRPGPHPSLGRLRNLFKRTHRWTRVLRHKDELAVTAREDKVTHVLFSTKPEDLGLYDKPMARNAQLWSKDFHCLLDGPHATRDDLAQAAAALKSGGFFGYRFQYPAMRVGRHEIYWHRPMVAYLDTKTGQAALLADAPVGYLTAYDAEKPDPAEAIELWPRLLRRKPHVAAAELFMQPKTRLPYQDRVNVRKLLDSASLLGTRLHYSFARALLTAGKRQTLDQWLEALPARASAPNRGQELADELRTTIIDGPTPLPSALTYHRTAQRSFETSYWRTIVSLAEGPYLTTNNADCVLDQITQDHLVHHRRDLNFLGQHLLRHYRKSLIGAGLRDVLIGELPFLWRTDFDFDWMGGWLHNQTGKTYERNLIIVIPGRDRSQAVVMADHYDTAYMEDRYQVDRGGDGVRLAAAGADDNHSATATLMLGAPIFLELSRNGQLDCDIWLIHLTGEEFPADSLGSRHLCQSLIEGNLQMHAADGAMQDLSGTRVRGVYVMDMIAHNNDHDRDTFQITPGTGAQSMWLAYQAHLSNEIWNASTVQWNRRKSRRNCGRGARSADGRTLPATARHLALNGQVRPHYDPRSTLYNSDGQIFSDAGVPVVLFMENYDINRTGYHDSHDTMADIDLDYGAALAAIAIESVARAAGQQVSA